MPPVLPRKRLRTPSPQSSPPSTRRQEGRSLPSRKAEPDVFHDLDKSRRAVPNVADSQAFLDALEDDQSSLSSADSDDDEFEDVVARPPPKKAKIKRDDSERQKKSRQAQRKAPPSPPPKPILEASKPRSAHLAKQASFNVDKGSRKAPSAAENKAFLDALDSEQSSLSSAESDNSDDFEDVLAPPKKHKVSHKHADADSDDDLEFEDVNGTEQEEELVAPEINENFEVTIKALGDGEQLPLVLKQGGKASITKKMRRARILAHCMHVQFLLWHNVIRNNWINDKEVHDILLKGLPEALKAEVTKWKHVMGYESPDSKKGRGKKGKGKGKKSEKPKDSRERIRDWGADAEKSAQHTQGDPLVRLLKYLAAYWKKRFVITAPSLRKLGYRNPRDMRAEMDSFNDGPHDPSRHGERIADIEGFRERARNCKGSRDIGAQLFTAMLRGLGIEARMVASLQPTGYGWSKNEEAYPRKKMSTATTDAAASETETSVKSTLKKPVMKAANGIKKGSSNRPINLDSDLSDLSSSLSSDEEKAVKITTPRSGTKPAPAYRFDRDLLYPTYWTEVLSPVSNTHIPISTMIHPNVITSAEHIGAFEPRGAAAEKAKQVMCYVVAFSRDGTGKDVTVRYLRKRIWPGRTKGLRIPVEKLPVFDHNGKIRRYEEYDWFKRVMRGYARPGPKRTLADDIEDESDLVPVQPEVDDKKKEAEPDSLQAYKQSPIYVLERHLRREEALKPGTKPVKHFHIGKGDKAIAEPVYKRSDVVLAKSVETWHKEGREIKFGEQALKQVAYRAVTLQRKREIEDQAREMGLPDGKKPLQGLYAEYQTEWIIPDPIGPDRAIPKNAFNNIDIYVPSMVPKGAIHIPLKGTARVCKRLGIDFAEACTGFEFGKQRAVPVITGVVVAEENEDLVIDAWQEDERIKQEKENKKREEKSLKLWKKFFRGLQVRERIRKEYGGSEDEDAVGDEVSAWAGKGTGAFGLGHGEVEGGGFLREGDDDGAGSVPDDDHASGGFIRDEKDAPSSPRTRAADTGGGFVLSEDEDEDVETSGFEIIGGSQDPSKRKRRHHQVDPEGATRHLPTPISLQAMHAEQADAASVKDEESDEAMDEAADDGSPPTDAKDEDEDSEPDDPPPSPSPPPPGHDEYVESDASDRGPFIRATPAAFKKHKAQAKANIRKADKAKREAARVEKSKITPKRRSKRNAGMTSSPYFEQ